MKVPWRNKVLADHGHGATVLAAQVLVALAVVGCATPPPAPSAVPTATVPPSATPVESGIPSESAPGPVIWGPLAVIPGGDSADTARTTGTLTITDQCVFLKERGGPVLLLWPANRTAWNAGDRTITFVNLDGSSFTVEDGAAVALGGGGGSSVETGVRPEVWLARMTWVARPAATCPLDPYWSVGDVRG